MRNDIVSLSVPAQPAYARSVRMMAANLAVLCDMDVDQVEDVRMAAEEGFVYSCATAPDMCDITFEIGGGSFSIEFALGPDEPDPDSADSGYVELILSAVCDEFFVDDDDVLHLVKRTDGANA